MTEQPVIEATELSRHYSTGAGSAAAPAVSGTSFRVGRGETVAITGPSGSGKSTLLFLLAGLDTPDAGSVRICGVDWHSLRGAARARFRRDRCGFIAQGMTLLPQATAAENVEVALVLAHAPTAGRSARVASALEQVGLSEHAAKLPDQLSGGQQQRVAIARALITKPAVVLADEPTASLDSATGQDIARQLVSSVRTNGTALVLITHDLSVAAHADRQVRLRSGVVESEG